VARKKKGKSGPPRLRLFERLSNPAELERGWLHVLSHYEKGQLPSEVARFENNRPAAIARLAAEIKSRQFLPDTTSLIRIPKSSKPGEFRNIALAKPEDRIVLTVLNRLLEPLFERTFSDRSYAYRRGRSALAAVARVEAAIAQGRTHAALGDIDDFFDSVDRARLLDILRRLVWEPPIRDLLETYLHIGSSVALEWTDTGRGITQGSPLSPLLSNIYLAGFDQFIDALGVEWVRYADNLILLAASETQARAALEDAERYLDRERGLKLNPDSRICVNAAQGFEFLGFWLQGGRRTMSDARLQQKKQALTEELRNRRGGLPAMVEKLSESARGWKNYYGTSPDALEQLGLLEQHLFDLLVEWLRRYRSEGEGKGKKPGELKSILVNLELPREQNRAKRVRWIELLLARTRPESATVPKISEAARKAIERRRAELRKRKDERSDVVVGEPGMYLGRSGERLIVRKEGKRLQETPLSMVRNISLLTPSVSISAELMRAASARGIGIHVLGDDGRPAVRIGPLESAAYDITAAQTNLAGGPEGLEIAQSFVAGKIRNQVNLLRYFGKYRGRRQGEAFLSSQSAAVAEMERIAGDVLARAYPPGTDIDLERNRLFAAEGQAALSYWGALRTLSWRNVAFEGRIRQGASDLVNVMLNYGYGILYSRLLAILLRAGLNVNIGFLHKPRGGKPVLLYDAIEEFRPAAVDRVVFGLLNLGKDFELEQGRLSQQGRKAMSKGVIDRLHATTRYRTERLPLEEVMEEQARLLLRHIEGKDLYRPWVWQW
jgi:CRISPR-associated endonuclease Cas1/group II intron reverse transcriptase/maturase